MNCKPGDLVVLLYCFEPELKKYVGAIRTVRSACPVHRGSWDLSPPILDRRGFEASWDDRDMRPIRDQDGTDEMIRIAGLPHKEHA